MTNEYEKAREAIIEQTRIYASKIARYYSHKADQPTFPSEVEFADAILHLDCIEVRAENQDVQIHESIIDKHFLCYFDDVEKITKEQNFVKVVRKP